MESFAEFLPLLFLLVYFLLGRKRRTPAPGQQGPQAPPPPGEARERARTPFEEMMREMEKAMGGAPDEPVSEPEPVLTPQRPRTSLPPRQDSPSRPAPPSRTAAPSRTVPPSRTTPPSRPVPERERVPQRRTLAPRPLDAGRQALGPLSKKAPGDLFGERAERPFSDSFERGEDRLDQAGSFERGGPLTEGRARPAPASGMDPPPAGAPASLWNRRLRSPAGARDALVLLTLFNGPWKRRRPGDRI